MKCSVCLQERIDGYRKDGLDESAMTEKTLCLHDLSEAVSASPAGELLCLKHFIRGLWT